jgi:signal transduction histidine kinase
MTSSQRTLLIVSACPKERARVARAVMHDKAHPTTCFHAESGEQALIAYPKTKPTGVVISTILPDMDGWTLLARLCETHGRLAAVVIGDRDGEVPVEPTCQGGEYEYLARRHATATATRRAVRNAIERRTLAQRIMKVEAELAAQRREMDEILSIAAHEIKNPLTTVLGHAQVLERRARRDGLATDHDRHDLQMIMEQTRRAAAMLDTMQDASLFENGVIKLAHEPVDLRALLARIVHGMRSSLGRYTLVLPTSTQPVIVGGDAARLEQVFDNLLQNAVKYSPHGGTISIDITIGHGTACVTISDTGLGIPATAIPHLFKRFYRVHTRETEHISGSGLGLYVVNEIVRQHGGRINVTSAEGIGSTFEVELPLYDDATLS